MYDNIMNDRIWNYTPRNTAEKKLLIWTVENDTTEYKISGRF
jgi:hypothetical protein